MTKKLKEILNSRVKFEEEIRLVEAAKLIDVILSTDVEIEEEAPVIESPQSSLRSSLSL